MNSHYENETLNYCLRKVIRRTKFNFSLNIYSLINKKNYNKGWVRSEIQIEII